MLPADPEERRSDPRRGDPLVSLARLFDAARKRTGLVTLVLSDSEGLAIAGAGSAFRCDELAARAPFSGPPANDTVPCRLDVITRTMQVRRLCIDGIEVFLCAEGEAPAPEELSAVAQGCERILARKRRG